MEMDEMKTTEMVRGHRGAAEGICNHQVQFYDDEAYLHDVLSDFFQPFLSNSERDMGAIVLARARTIKYLQDSLTTRGYISDGDHGRNDSVTSMGTVYRRGGQSFLLVDGDEVLRTIIPHDVVDAQEFERRVLNLVSLLHPERLDGPIYAYGELVDILCARGQHLLALELEGLWNRLLAFHDITLLCGYKMDSFSGSRVENIFEQICHSHAAVVPTESYSSLATEEQRLAMVAVLQQKATVLRAPQPRWKDDPERQVLYREQFVDVLCHELRNPVGGIIGNVELLQMGLDTRHDIINGHHEPNGDTWISAANIASLQQQLADDIDSVDAIAVCAEHMKAVTDDVLSLSKLEEGKVVLELLPFDIKASVASAVKMFSTAAKKKGIQLQAMVPKEELVVLGDRGRVTQVLVNLISNAIKFTDTGKVIVELICLGPTLQNSTSVFKIAVRDTGCGLNREEISQLFQRFAQPASQSFAKHGGSGLGLYISKQLVQLMGGLLYVESLKGDGSTFFFTFQADLCTELGSTKLLDHELDQLVVTEDPSLPSTVIYSPVEAVITEHSLSSTSIAQPPNAAIAEQTLPVTPIVESAPVSVIYSPVQAIVGEQPSSSASSILYSALKNTYRQPSPPSSINYPDKEAVGTERLPATPVEYFPEEVEVLSTTTVMSSEGTTVTPPTPVHLPTEVIVTEQPLVPASPVKFPQRIPLERRNTTSPILYPTVSVSTTSTTINISARKHTPYTRHILLVDDNPIILRTLTRLLERAPTLSISVTTASNGYDAIGKLISLSSSSFPIDLVLMDVEMPFLSGLHTTREIRRLSKLGHEPFQSVSERRQAERLASTPIIGMTGNVRESQFTQARQSGMDECVGKPIAKDALLRLIYRLTNIQKRGPDDTDQFVV